ncbi:uncharacterized protein [Macrobrachium rosenbergii]|uniref:uncharacterized protein n=1 Tax=Macrobrachium rosenbergii TaxID=79674 RepID=UPI0034D45F7A
MLTPMFALLCLLTTHQINRCAAQVLITRTEPLSHVARVQEAYGDDGNNKASEKESTTTDIGIKFITSSSILEEDRLKNPMSTSTLRDGEHTMSSTVVRVAGVETTSSADPQELGLKYIPSTLLAEVRLQTTAALGEKTRTISTISFENRLQTLSIQSSGNQTPWVSSTQSLGTQTSRILSMQSLGTQTSRVSATQSLGTHTSRVSATQSLGTQTSIVSSMQCLDTQTLRVSSTQNLGTQTSTVSSTQSLDTQTLRVSSTQSLGTQTSRVSSTQSLDTQTLRVSSTQSLGTQTSRVSSTQSLGTQTSRVSSTQSLDTQTLRVSSTQSLGTQTSRVSSTQSLGTQTLRVSVTQSMGAPTPKVSSTQSLGNQTPMTDHSRSSYHDDEQLEQSQTSSENMNVLSAILSPSPRPRNDPKAQTDTSSELKNTKEVQNSNKSEVSLTSETSFIEYNVDFVQNNSNILQNNDSNCGHDNEASQCDTDDENALNSSTVDERYVFTGTSERTTTSFPFVSDTNNSRPESKNNTESIKVPFCCFELQTKNHCPRFRQHNLALPVAEDHCKQPTLKNVSITPRRTLNCSANNRIKISLNTESKVISSSAEMALFSFNHWFISEFCIEADLELANQWWAVICALDVNQEQEDSCPENKCLQKCCPVGHALKNDSCVCHVGKSVLSEIIDASLANASGRYHDSQFSRFGMPNCKEPSASYFLDLNGEKKDLDLVRRNIIRGEQSPSREWSCIDDSLDELENVTRLVKISCREPKDGTWKTLRNVLIPAGLIVSCVFLLCTLTCHLCVAPLRDLHGLCLAAYMGALLVGDASLFTIKMYSGVLSKSACLAMGTIIHVSFLSTFMWLNVVCIDIWNYVGQTVQAVPLYRNPSNLRWFIVYGLYAWGCPIIFGGVIGGLQASPANHNLSFLPDFAANSCWFNGDDFWETLLFFYGPIGIMFIVNAYFIVHTGMRLYCLHYCCCLRSLCCFIPSPYNTQQQPPLHRTYLNEFWERFSLFALLVCCWGTEFISWLSGSGDSEIWGLTDTINAFQGFFIFLIFLRSTKKRRLLKSSINKWLNNLSTTRSALCKRMSFPQSMPARHLVANLRNTVSAKKPLSSGILKDKLTETTSIDKIICNEVTRGCDSKPDGDVGSPEVTSQNPSPVWTVIPQWKSLKSRSYFLHNVGVGHSKDGSNRIFENLGDLQNIYLPREGEERNRNSHLNRKSSCESNSFEGWTLMKTRTGSISLKDDRHGWDDKSGVVCQALTKRDSK